MPRFVRPVSVRQGLKGDKEHTAEEKLQSYFVQRMEKVVNKHGKKMIGWDEILEGGLAPSATVMSWRGEEGGIAAASMNHDVIMIPGKRGYVYRPVPRRLQDRTRYLSEDSPRRSGSISTTPSPTRWQRPVKGISSRACNATYGVSTFITRTSWSTVSILVS